MRDARHLIGWRFHGHPHCPSVTLDLQWTHAARCEPLHHHRGLTGSSRSPHQDSLRGHAACGSVAHVRSAACAKAPKVTRGFSCPLRSRRGCRDARRRSTAAIAHLHPNDAMCSTVASDPKTGDWLHHSCSRDATALQVIAFAGKYQAVKDRAHAGWRKWHSTRDHWRTGVTICWQLMKDHHSSCDDQHGSRSFGPEWKAGQRDTRPEAHSSANTASCSAV